MGLFTNFFKKNKEVAYSFDIGELGIDVVNRVYLKQIALETCINFVARTISQSEFRFMKDKKRQLNDWDYMLNVRPNQNQSASDFWQQFTYRLIDENEVLVILSDTNDLLIADDFTREEYAVYPDTFTNVVVKDYEFKRSFKMDEVIYLDYNNEKLDRYMNSLFKDYNDLFSRLIEVGMRTGQIRGTVDIDSTQDLNEDNRKKLQNYINRLFSSFKEKSIAIVPKLKGFDYQELTNTVAQQNQRAVEEITKLKRDLTNEVANIIGIPISLIHGDMQEYETAIKAYIKFCIAPLNKKIKDELNAKLLTRSEYLSGHRIEVKGISEMNPLELATAVDKLVGSGAYNRNEIREKMGDERVDNPALDEYVLTKNYESVEGGENNGEKTDEG